MVLVTGGAGFIGSHLVEALLARGKRVRVLDDFSSGKWENLAPFVDDIEIIEGDVVDLPTVLSALDGVQYVLHHAAVASVEQSVRNPVRVHSVNVDGPSTYCWRRAKQNRSDWFSPRLLRSMGTPNASL